MKNGALLAVGICLLGSVLAGQDPVASGQERSACTDKPQSKKNQSTSKEQRGPIDILTDTGGVDFLPFLRKSIHKVKMNWYDLIPEIAKPPFRRKGEVVISFRVMRDGKIENAQIYEKSGDNSLDQAAWQAIFTSNPLPALPSDFACKYADLRFHFYYNPDANDPAAGKDFPVLPCVTSKINVGDLAGFEVSPNSVQVPIGHAQQFIATAVHPGETILWSVSGAGCTGPACGTITAEGLYTAPDNVPQPPTVTVTATLETTPPVTASGTLTIVPPDTAH